jgi:hypothetical protein
MVSNLHHPDLGICVVLNEPPRIPDKVPLTPGTNLKQSVQTDLLSRGWALTSDLPLIDPEYQLSAWTLFDALESKSERRAWAFLKQTGQITFLKWPLTSGQLHIARGCAALVFCHVSPTPPARTPPATEGIQWMLRCSPEHEQITMEDHSYMQPVSGKLLAMTGECGATR